MSHNATREAQARLLNANISRGSAVSLTNPIPVIGVGTTVVVSGAVTIAGPDPLPTEDTGLHTNPRRYEILNAFRSQVLALNNDVPTVLMSLTTDPARTAGEGLFIYKLCITNRSGFLTSVSLEQPVGTEIHQRIFVDNDDSVNESFPTPIPVGITGLFARRHSTTGTTAYVDVQILGLEV